MVLIHRILLIQIQLEEFIMPDALEILVADLNVSLQ